MIESQGVDAIAVAKTPAGGWAKWPAPILASCKVPPIDGAPLLDGYWRIIAVVADGETAAEHWALGNVQRIEQRADRLVVTAAGVIHDMRCDGTIENGVHDVAEFDKTTPIHVVASYEDGDHVLRPDGLPIEVRRRRVGDFMIWDYVGFTARLEHIAPSDALPHDVGDVLDVARLTPTTASTDTEQTATPTKE